MTIRALTVRIEVVADLEAPAQGTDDPVLQSLNVELGLLVDLLIPEVRDSLAVGELILAYLWCPLMTKKLSRYLILYARRQIVSSDCFPWSA